MSSTPMEFLQEPERVRLALSPMRRQLLDRLREPASATQVASELNMSRQRVNYHLRVLEAAGLVEVVEERQRRGCVERILRISAKAFVVDPSVMGMSGATISEDEAEGRFAAEHLVEVAAEVIRDVAGMQAKAKGQGTRVLTFTIETEVNLVGPADVGHFTAALSELVARAASEFNAPTVGRKYRVIVGGHPAPQRRARTRDERPPLNT